MCQLKALALAKEQGEEEKLVFPSGFQMHMKRKYCFLKYIINLQWQHSYQNLESSGCNCSGNTKNSAFKLRNCLLCAHLHFRKKLKFFIKFTFLKIFKFLLLKKLGARLIQENTVFNMPTFTWHSAVVSFTCSIIYCAYLRFIHS
jgi:hypothetical protein